MADKVTAGDWSLDPFGRWDKRIGIQNRTCLVDNDDVAEGEGEANARFIVAAVNPLFEINPEHPEKVAPEIGEAFKLLREAEIQIEYLHRKFKPTGTGENVLAKLRALLSRIDTDTKEQGT